MEVEGWARDLAVDEEGERRAGALAVDVEGEGKAGGPSCGRGRCGVGRGT